MRSPGAEELAVSKRRGNAPTKRREGAAPEIDRRRSARLSWRYRLGRVLQFLGLLILPFGIASELLAKVGLGQSLLIAGGGALVFYAGYVIQHGDRIG